MSKTPQRGNSLDDQARPVDSAAETADKPIAIRPPSAQTETPLRIGGYRILRSIGEGGMGIVYEAEQEKPVRRTVALKLIKWGMDTRSVVARFESERQALALMNHPNIARGEEDAAEGARGGSRLDHDEGAGEGPHAALRVAQ